MMRRRTTTTTTKTVEDELDEHSALRNRGMAQSMCLNFASAALHREAVPAVWEQPSKQSSALLLVSEIHWNGREKQGSPIPGRKHSGV